MACPHCDARLQLAAGHPPLHTVLDNHEEAHAPQVSELRAWRMRRQLAQQAGGLATMCTLVSNVHLTGKRHYLDEDVLFEDANGDADADWTPGAETEWVPRGLPADCHVFDASTLEAWQTMVTTTVIPALVDAPGNGRYGYVMQVSSPVLPACVDGCACQNGTYPDGCYFVLFNKLPCTVYGIEVPANTPLYMCSGGGTIVGPAQNTLSPPMYYSTHKNGWSYMECVVNKRWIKIAEMGLNPLNHQYVRFGTGRVGDLWALANPLDGNRLVDAESWTACVAVGANRLVNPENYVREAARVYAANARMDADAARQFTTRVLDRVQHTGVVGDAYDSDASDSSVSSVSSVSSDCNSEDDDDSSDEEEHVGAVVGELV